MGALRLLTLGFRLGLTQVKAAGASPAKNGIIGR
jgi:hypothetical protein